MTGSPQPLRPRSPDKPAPARPTKALRTLGAAGLGTALGIALLKAGNPVILGHLVDPPTNLAEFLIGPWPLRWSAALLGIAFLLNLPSVSIRNTATPWFIRWLPLAWLAWQCLSATQTVDSPITRVTIAQLFACTLCFYAGLFGLHQADQFRVFSIPLMISFWLLLLAGFDQHYGGLESTRQLVQQQPGWQDLPPEYLKRIESNRVFATLFYPNTLAGAILLLLPLTLYTCWNVFQTPSSAARRIGRATLAGSLAYAALACLYWSGSKAGWLVAAATVAPVVWRSKLPRRAKWLVLSVAMALACAGFLIRFSSYLEKGATSASARLDYWKVAVSIAAENPILGSGPGTFGTLYKTRKSSESEMARLAHNDYLQQASDSGLPAFLLFTTLIAGSVALLYRYLKPASADFAIWLGLFAWSLHEITEFDLFVPAVSWTAFVLLGALWRRCSGMSWTSGDGFDSVPNQ